MDLPEATVSAVAFTPPLPSYTEAIQSPQSLTPPPTYGEAGESEASCNSVTSLLSVMNIFFFYSRCNVITAISMNQHGA